VAEETGIDSVRLHPLDFRACVPVEGFAARSDWPESLYVIPEYTFAFEADTDPILSAEHTELAWLYYDAACMRVRWDSNRSALWELRERLLRADLSGGV